MRIPKYWSQATVREMDRNGKDIRFSCWRWSDQSTDDAHESAVVAARRILSSLLRREHLNRYDYGQVPLREEALEQFTDSQGGLSAALTRNSYGALILNAARVMFIDLDFPSVSAGEQLRYWFARLLRKSVRSPEAEREESACRRLEQFVNENPRWSLRVYRTFAGLRALATHDLFDPTSAATHHILRSLGTDPLYVRLCKAQDCFRARLTPKPWRCGCAQSPQRWPREEPGQQRQFEEWLSVYDARHTDFATCRFLKTLGEGHVHPDVAHILDLHDQTTRCHESMDLA